MLDERARGNAGDDIATDVAPVDAWAAELTAIAYGTVPVAYDPAPDAPRGAHLTLVSSIDEPLSISPDEPDPGVPYDHAILASPVWREDTAADATIEQLARDIVAITQARDALMVRERSVASPSVVPAPPSSARMRRAPAMRGAQSVPALRASPALVMTTVPFALRRTADSVPIILGSVLGFLMITVVSIAAVFIKFAR